MDLIVCRICVVALEGIDCCEVNSNITNDKTVLQLMQDLAQIKLEYPDTLPQYICVDCTEKLCFFHEFAERIRQTDKNFKDDNLTLIKLESSEDITETMYAFAGHDFDVSKVNKTVQKEKDNYEYVDNIIVQNDCMDIGENSPLSQEEANVSQVESSGDELFEIGEGKSKFRRKCPDCGEIFTTLCKYEKHRVVHTGEGPYICNICNKQFAFQRYLRQHLLVHREEKQYACDECPKKCRLRSQLLIHKKKIHSLIKPFVCDSCGKAFALRVDLKKHKVIHSTEKPYMCDICSKQFRGRDNLIAHKKNHSRKPVACEICGKVVMDKYMPKHMELHDPTKYECDVCGKQFNLQLSLYDHKRLKHKGKVKESCACEICGQIFSQYSAYVRHKRNLHMGIRYKCTACNAIYGEKNRANNHKKRVHPELAYDNGVIVCVKIGSFKMNASNEDDSQTSTHIQDADNEVEIDEENNFDEFETENDC